METKHTPGPWTVKPRPDGLANIYHAAGVHDVALCARPNDARLIAAAPDLLAALEAFVAHGTIDPEDRRRARAAIAKARGQ